MNKGLCPLCAEGDLYEFVDATGYYSVCMECEVEQCSPEQINRNALLTVAFFEDETITKAM